MVTSNVSGRLVRTKCTFAARRGAFGTHLLSRRVSLMIIANNDDDDDRGYDFSHAVGFDEKKVTKLAHQLTPSKLAATAVVYNSTFTHVFSLSLQIRLISAPSGTSSQ